MDLDNFIQTIRYVTCIGVKIPSQGDFEPAMTFFSFKEWKRAIRRMSQNRDSHSGRRRQIQGIMILLRCHRLSVEAGWSPVSRHTLERSGRDPGVTVPCTRLAAESLMVSQR